jgi:hypothetical protein
MVTADGHCGAGDVTTQEQEAKRKFCTSRSLGPREAIRALGPTVPTGRRMRTNPQGRGGPTPATGARQTPPVRERRRPVTVGAEAPKK